MVADDERLVACVGAVPVRLLSERMGLTGGLSAAMRRRGFQPRYGRGQILVDLALTLILGGEAISDIRALDHLGDVLGPMPSVPTVWRALSEIGDLQLKRIDAAMAGFRRHWWGLLEARPEGFPWLKVAGKELTGGDGGGPGRLGGVHGVGQGERGCDLQGRYRVLPEPGDLRQRR